MGIVKIALTTTAVLTLLALAAGAAVVWGGLYDVAATTRHTQPVFSLMHYAMRRSVSWRAQDVEVPALDARTVRERGALCYRDKCLACHGGPGVARAEMARGMQPLPTSLVDAARDTPLAELYWITRHGIRMSGMPGWQAHLSDEDIWATAAFVAGLRDWQPAEFRAHLRSLGDAACRSEPAALPGPPDPRRGRELINQYACTACHTVPGVASTKPQVGPPLNGYANQQMIAGQLANTPDNLARWIRAPQSIDAQSAMPDLGVSEAHARDIAAYLGTLR
jgi:mono/diheme cytochrome c family protein